MFNKREGGVFSKAGGRCVFKSGRKVCVFKNGGCVRPKKRREVCF